MQCCGIFFFLFLIFFMPIQGLAKSLCIACHQKETPEIVKQFLSSKMGKAGLNCSTCHGSAHKKGAADALSAKFPTPKICRRCHPKQVEQYKKGKHSLGWKAMESMPMYKYQGDRVFKEGYKGCSECHKIGLKSAEELKAYRYGNAACDSCHTRHAFSKKEAQDPRACQSCHIGFGHPQWEMWSKSKHGTIWQIEGIKSGRASTCQTCHMAEGNHQVMTAWGHFAVRFPEDDKEWRKHRSVILQALGIIDDNGKATERSLLFQEAKMARFTKEAFVGERQRMLKICSTCHSRSYAKKQLEIGDTIIQDADKLMADAIQIVKKLYEDKVLTVPKSWKIAPDLLQFYEAKSSIEQNLFNMFFRYRMRAFQGAFHINANSMQWNGWAKMKETLQKIKDEEKRLRAEHKSKL